MKVLKLKPLMTVEESDKWEGRILKEQDCTFLITEDCDVYDEESGKCLAKFRKKVLSVASCIKAYDNLLQAASLTDSRGLAVGKKDGKASKFRVRKDGSVSKQLIANGIKINSGVAGYFDRANRPGLQHCRLTSFTRNHFEKFIEAYPIIKEVDELYKKLMPVEYKFQRSVADKTAKDFVITDTAFTTVTVNKNYTTAVHKDSGDLKKGFGNLVALRKGTYTGCNFVLPRWGCGFDLRNGDLLLVDVHQWHGNTPMVLDEKDAVRLSLVMYYRENMVNCGTMEQELDRVKKRKKGDKLQ